jgi:acyl carrier protein phosphodiesterase
MNFLAHLYLSGTDEKVLIGNFIADFVKGKNFHQAYDASIAKGIALHRFIDEYTDQHPVVTESKKRLRSVYRHYSAVIVDVFYDHFLARYWSEFHSIPLDTFAKFCYETIQDHEPILPEGIRYMLPYMIRGNWLLNYSKIEGINRALTGMSRRTPYESKMDEATNDLVRHYEEFKSEFYLFFPDLRKNVDEWLSVST